MSPLDLRHAREEGLKATVFFFQICLIPKYMVGALALWEKTFTSLPISSLRIEFALHVYYSANSAIGLGSWLRCLCVNLKHIMVKHFPILKLRKVKQLCWFILRFGVIIMPYRVNRAGVSSQVIWDLRCSGSGPVQLWQNVSTGDQMMWRRKYRIGGMSSC